MVDVFVELWKGGLRFAEVGCLELLEELPNCPSIVTGMVCGPHEVSLLRNVVIDDAIMLQPLS